jgi:S1-C subfamily serine protease
MNLRNATFFLALPLLASCSAIASADRALARWGVMPVREACTAQRHTVAVRAQLDGQWSRGHGVVLAADTVITVAHVVPTGATVWVAAGEEGGWAPATVVEQRAGSPEPLVVLRLEVASGLAGLVWFSGFAEERVAALHEGEGIAVATPRGLVRAAAGLEPGDSGCPVIDGGGDVVALLSGRSGLHWVSTAPAPRALASAR